MNYILDIIANVSLIAMCSLIRSIADDTKFDDKLNRVGIMVVLVFNITLFVCVIIFHCYKYIIAVRCKCTKCKVSHRYLRASKLRQTESYHEYYSWSYDDDGDDCDNDIELREPLLADENYY